MNDEAEMTKDQWATCCCFVIGHSSLLLDSSFGFRHSSFLTPPSPDVRLLLPPAQVALHDARRQLAAARVEREALGEAGELVDEADPVHAPVVLDQGERGDAAAVADG